MRDRSVLDEYRARPFTELDLENQNLSGLALQGADLNKARLQHSQMDMIDLGPVGRRKKWPATKAELLNMA